MTIVERGIRNDHLQWDSDSIRGKLFLGQRVQGREGRTTSREVDTGPCRADAVAVQSLKGDQIPAEEIKFQKPGTGVRDQEAES